MYNPPNPKQLSVDFRRSDLEAIFGHIHAGQSIEIIGVGSVGKSNFVRQIQRRDVQDHYLYQARQEQSHCVFINLDANSLLEPIPSLFDPKMPSSWPGYELLASRLLKAVMENELVRHITNPNDPAFPDSLWGMYHRLWPDSTQGGDMTFSLAYRYIEDLVQRIFIGANRPIRLIFIFDEFEKFIAELPVRFFQSLRSLRDQYKDRVLYMTTSRQIIPLLIPQQKNKDYEPFYELFVTSRHFLLPYRPSDTEQTFKRLSARRDQAPPPANLREQFLAVTGGHAGLIRAAFTAWAQSPRFADNMSDAEVVNMLLNVQAIQDECKTIWGSLSQQEQQILFEMVRAQQRKQRTDMRVYNPFAYLLIRKGMLLESTSMGFDNIRPPVFAAFLLSQIPTAANTLNDIDFATNPINWWE